MDGTPAYLQTHQLRADSMVLSFDEEITQLTDQLGDRQHLGVTLVKDQPLNVVLTVLKEGGSLHEHAAAGPTTVHVLRGAVRAKIGEKSVDVAAGQALVFGPAVKHDVIALEPSALLITVAFSRARSASG